MTSDEDFLRDGRGYNPMRGMLMTLFLHDLRRDIEKDPATAVARIDSMLTRLAKIEAEST